MWRLWKNKDSMKVCCIFNYNPLYRFPIYKAISEKFDCDFFFARPNKCDIKQFDPNELRGFKSLLDVKRINRIFTTYCDINKTLKSDYTHFILTGEPYVLSNWIIIIYALLTGKKVYLWTHGLYSHVKKIWTRIYLKLFYKHVDLLLYGESSLEYMLDLGCKRDKIHFIHNSLNTDFQSSVYSENLKSDIYNELFGNSSPVVIYIGRIQKVKKIDQLIKALSILKSKGYIVNLILVGPDSDDHSIKYLVDQLELSNQVYFYGECFDEIKNAELIYNADVCVSPGNVGLTCIHSLTYGTPVITNDNFKIQMPEYEAIIPGVTGDFFKENDVDDLSTVILNWVDLNEDQRNSIRNSARETVLKSWSVQYQMSLFETILK